MGAADRHTGNVSFSPAASPTMGEELRFIGRRVRKGASVFTGKELIYRPIGTFGW